MWKSHVDLIRKLTRLSVLWSLVTSLSFLGTKVLSRRTLEYDFRYDLPVPDYFLQAHSMSFPVIIAVPQYLVPLVPHVAPEVLLHRSSQSKARARQEYHTIHAIDKLGSLL